MAKMANRITEKMKKVSPKADKKLTDAKKMASAMPSSRSAAKQAAYKAAGKVVRKQLVSERTPAGTAQRAAKKAVPVVAMRIASDRSRAATRSRAEGGKLAAADKMAKKKAVSAAARKIVSGR